MGGGEYWAVCLPVCLVCILSVLYLPTSCFVFFKRIFARGAQLSNPCVPALFVVFLNSLTLRESVCVYVCVYSVCTLHGVLACSWVHLSTQYEHTAGQSFLLPSRGRNLRLVSCSRFLVKQISVIFCSAVCVGNPGHLVGLKSNRTT
jgi:hypothetical protein